MIKYMVTILMLFGFVVSANATTITIRNGSLSGDSAINNYYNGPGGFTSQIVNTVTAASLSGTDLLLVWEPNVTLSGAEISDISAFLGTGNRVAFFGEHNSFTTENNNINAAVSALGGNLTIINSGYFDTGYNTATQVGGQITNHVLNNGVNTFQYGAPSELSMVSGGEALFLSQDLSKVWAAHESVAGGSLVVVTDSNVTNLSGSFDNDVFFDNLVTAQTVAVIPEPATMLLLGSGLIGLAGFRRKFRKS